MRVGNTAYVHYIFKKWMNSIEIIWIVSKINWRKIGNTAYIQFHSNSLDNVEFISLKIGNTAYIQFTF